MKKNKKILIVSYSYSTKSGVGARRWIKFSHQLALMGYDIIVLCCENELDIHEKSEQIEYITYPSIYPQILNKSPSSILDKFRYRIALKKQALRTEGLIYDKSVLDEKMILSQIEKIIKTNSIENLIISGAPFSLLYFGVKIKQINPSLNYIADFRDPWTWGHGYGMNNLSPKRKLKEKAKEFEVMKLADHVVVASSDMYSSISEIYPNYRDKLKMIQNGIEGDSFSLLSSEKGVENSLFTIVHIGSVNSGTEKYWSIFFESIKKVKFECNVVFIGNGNKQFERYLQSEGIKNVEIKKRVPENKLRKTLLAADCFVMFKKDGFENSFPSKFFDYVKCSKPILAFTEDGDVSYEINENGIGFTVSEKSDVKYLISYINEFEDQNVKFNAQYDWSKFTIENLSLQIEELL